MSVVLIEYFAIRFFAEHGIGHADIGHMQAVIQHLGAMDEQQFRFYVYMRHVALGVSCRLVLTAFAIASSGTMAGNTHGLGIDGFHESQVIATGTTLLVAGTAACARAVALVTDVLMVGRLLSG